MNPFDFLNSINTTKENLIREDPLNEKEYTPYLVNRGLSYFRDTIFYANEMNRYPELPKKLQYEFYLHGVPKRKRFSKWAKKSTDSQNDLELIAKEYDCSIRKAEVIYTLLTPEQIVFIRDQYSHGGTRKVKKDK